MNWDDLRVFLAVERAGSIRGAARLLGKTHATISRRLQALEIALDAQILERRHDGPALTELGSNILPLAQEIERYAGKISERAYSAREELAGPVTISLPESLYSAILAPFIEGFIDSYPRITLNIVTTDELLSLARGEAHVVVRITNQPSVSAFGKKVADCPSCLYASESYLRNRPLEDLWVAYDDQPDITSIPPTSIPVRLNSPLLASQLVASGRGIGVFPCYIGETNPRLRRIGGIPLKPDREIWILTQSGLSATPRIRALLDYLYDAFKSQRAIIEGRAEAPLPKNSPG